MLRGSVLRSGFYILSLLRHHSTYIFSPLLILELLSSDFVFLSPEPSMLYSLPFSLVHLITKPTRTREHIMVLRNQDTPLPSSYSVLFPSATHC